MSEPQTPFEQNLGRLMRASVGPTARPSAEASETLKRRLAAELRRPPVEAEFPVPALATLSGVALLVCGICLARCIGAYATDAMPAFAAPAILLTLNFLSLPIACTIIVLRRKHV